MTPVLQLCRVVWGETARIAAPPPLRRVVDALYRPPSTDGAWALTGPDGTVLEAAGLAPAVTGAPAVAEDRPHLFIGPVVDHYGHFLVGTLGRLWPLLAWDGPPPRLLCHGLGPGQAPPALPFLDVILGRFGLSAHDLVGFDGPTRIPHLVLPGPSLKEQAFAHAIHGDLTRAIGRPFWDAAAVDTVARPVYLSKSRLVSGVSRMRNEDALCAALARRGVDIAFPETLALPDLVRLISERRMVLGTTGSAFHTAAFAAPGRRIVGLNWAPHLNANFPLLDGVNATQARYYHPTGSQSGPDAGFQFGWSIPDPEAVATELLWRAERFADLDAIDDAQDQRQRRVGRGAVWGRFGRWLSRRS